MNPTVLRRLALFDVVGMTLLVQWFIWRLQFDAPHSWIIFPVWITASFLLHRDKPKTLGWRADNLWAATKQSVLPFLLFAAVCVAVGWWLDEFKRLPPNWVAPRRLWLYFAFCLLQQVALQSFLNNRLMLLAPNRWLSSVLTGLIFGVSHLPNPVLVPVTFVGGVVMARLFATQRNVIPLAIGQALLCSLVWACFPIAWHHFLRVGPGYYRWP